MITHAERQASELSTRPAGDYIELELPPLLHVGIVVLDMAAAAADFERRWGTRVTEVREITLQDALYHDRATTISFQRGLIGSGATPIELIQPFSNSPFSDFLAVRKGDGLHHLAYVVNDIDTNLARLKPTCAELVLDATLPSGDRAVFLDGFAHGPTIELIQREPAQGMNQ